MKRLLFAIPFSFLLLSNSCISEAQFNKLLESADSNSKTNSIESLAVVKYHIHNIPFDEEFKVEYTTYNGKKKNQTLKYKGGWDYGDNHWDHKFSYKKSRFISLKLIGSKPIPKTVRCTIIVNNETVAEKYGNNLYDSVYITALTK